MTRTAPRRVGAVLLLAAAITTGLAGTAHATAAAPEATTSPVTLSSFSENVNLSTRTSSATKLCATNIGGQYGLLRLQALRPNATPEFIELQPNTTRCVDRWWSGVSVNAMNVSASPLSVRTF